jgi:sugar lactone lactonase YvrE
MSTEPQSRPTLFQCPSCGAKLEVVDAPSVTCKYCGNSVPVPPELRPQKPQVIIQQIPTQMPDFTPYTPAARSGQRLGCIITVIILVITIGAIGSAVFISQSAITTVSNVLQDQGINVQLPGAPAKPAFANVVMEFGDKGSGPGLMDDPRHVAIDKDGNIWTGDYQDGRVQKFDPEGKFLLQINVPPDDNDNTLIDGLAADYQGSLYVTRGGDLLKYSLAGELLKTIPGKFPDTRYQGLAVDATNTVYALHTTASDNALIKLDANGKQLNRWNDIVTNVNKKDAAMELGVALDGVGNIYIASFFGNQVYIYDKSGKFVDRFGQEGNEPGQFNGPQQVAVDGKNHLYVRHSGGIDQFDTGGRYLGSLPIDYAKGAPMGLTVDRTGFIYVVTNNGKVLKYQLTGK